MTPLALFLVSVAVLSAAPLLMAAVRSQFQAVLLYTHIAAMVVLGGLFGVVHTLPLGGGVELLAGQLYYGSFIFTTLLATIVGRDLLVVRQIIAVVIVVDVLAVIALQLAHAGLTTPGAENIFGVPPEMFAASTVQQISGAVLSVAELLLLLAVLECAKSRLDSRQMIPVYPLTFVLILLFDGLLFPLLVLRPESGLVGIMVEGVQGKLVLALAYSVPLLAFVVLSRRTLQRYETRQLELRHLMDLSRDPLLHQLDEQRSRLATTAERAGSASATTARILDAATSTVLIATDPGLVVTEFNTGAERILGRTAEGAVGRPLAELVPPDEVARQARELGLPAEVGSVVAGQATSRRSRDWELPRGDGSRVVLSLNVTCIESEGRLVGYLLAGEDVTSRHRAEEAARVALDNEQQSRARLQEADRVKRQLISTVSHELRTPITSVRGYLELLQDGHFGELGTEQLGALERVLRNTGRLERLVSDLLLLERAEGAGITPGRQPLDLREIVGACVDLLREQARAHVLELHLPDQPVPAVGDAEALQRVVLNLVDNAVKFTPAGGTVTVSARGVSSGARLEIRDTGIGINAADRRRLFTRFFRSADALAMEAQGTGLGLAIVHAIVTEHDGSIRVDSEIGHGTTVTVDLPA